MAEETNPLHELFEDQIKDLYSAENQIIKALPKMAKKRDQPAAADARSSGTSKRPAARSTRLEQIARGARHHAHGQEVQGHGRADRGRQGS